MKIRGSFHRRHYVTFKNMKIRKYNFCGKFNFGRTLEFL